MAEHWAWETAVPQVTARSLQNLADQTTWRRGRVPGPLTRSVTTDPRGAELLGLLGRVPAGDAQMIVLGPVPRAHERGDLRTYRATLSFGGVIPAHHDVEIDVTHFGANLAEVTVRSAQRLARRVSEDRYQEAVIAALASLERLLPWQAIVAETATAAPVGSVLDTAARQAPVEAPGATDAPAEDEDEGEGEEAA